MGDRRNDEQPFTMTTSTDLGDPFDPPPTARHATEPDGEVFIWQPCGGVVVEKLSGSVTLPLARVLGEFYEPMVASGAHFCMFVDLHAVGSYTRGAREYFVRSTRDRGASVEAIHFLAHSKELALGVSSFKLLIGDVPVHTYFDRASFARSYETAVRTATALH
jgi:hypothetical protein